MAKFIFRRILQFIPIILLSTVLVFTIVRLTPGDPVEVQFGPRASDARYAESIESYRRELGLEKPIIIQYFLWLKNVVQGDFGESIRSQQPVLDLILEKLPATLELLFAGILIGLIFGIPFAIIAGLNKGSLIDSSVSIISVSGLAIPGFWLGMILLWIFALKLKWLPASGHVPFFEDPVENLKRLIMPAITLGVYEIALVTRFLRAEIVEVVQTDYIRFARVKGLSGRVVIGRHILKNAMLSLVTIIALEIGYLLGGVVVVEQVFGWPGIGWLAYQAITNRDYPIIQAIVVLIAVGYALTNLIADILYGYLDPRMRIGAKSL